MSQPAKVEEPSMEEILASIRRIIADDETKPADVAPEIAPAPAAALSVEPPSLAPSPPAPMAAEPAHPVADDVAPPPKSKLGSSRVVPEHSPEEIDEMLADIEDIMTPKSADAVAEDDVFDLTDDMALPPQPVFNKIEPREDLEFHDAMPAMSAKERFNQARHSTERVAETPREILSQSTASSVENAFNALATTVLSNNARTLEDLVKEMLRPMLKGWLDDNLPPLVERIVRSEIERVSRGGR